MISAVSSPVESCSQPPCAKVNISCVIWINAFLIFLGRRSFPTPAQEVADTGAGCRISSHRCLKHAAVFSLPVIRAFCLCLSSGLIKTNLHPVSGSASWPAGSAVYKQQPPVNTHTNGRGHMSRTSFFFFPFNPKHKADLNPFFLCSFDFEQIKTAEFFLSPVSSVTLMCRYFYIQFC